MNTKRMNRTKKLKIEIDWFRWEITFQFQAKGHSDSIISENINYLK